MKNIKSTKNKEGEYFTYGKYVEYSFYNTLVRGLLLVIVVLVIVLFGDNIATLIK